MKAAAFHCDLSISRSISVASRSFRPSSHCPEENCLTAFSLSCAGRGLFKWSGRPFETNFPLFHCVTRLRVLRKMDSKETRPESAGEAFSEKKGDYKDAGLEPNVDIPVPQRTGIAALYAHPLVQISLVGFTCFLCPGFVITLPTVTFFSRACSADMM
jgi:hypothetical protein